jgi:6-pyruvoyltetrahydropterin/6-carboxytetrahydropterin synthase
MELSKEFRFEASHILPKHPGKCSRLHGHSWVLKVYVKGEIDTETGFVIDYADLKKVVQPIVDSLDHRHLGQGRIPGDDIVYLKMWEEWSPAGMGDRFYPSSENLLMWIAGRLTTPIGGYDALCFPWSRLELNETCTSSCILTREEYETQTLLRAANISR